MLAKLRLTYSQQTYRMTAPNGSVYIITRGQQQGQDDSDSVDLIQDDGGGEVPPATPEWDSICGMFWAAIENGGEVQDQ